MDENEHRGRLRSLHIRLEVALPGGTPFEYGFTFVEDVTFQELDELLRAEFRVPSQFRLAVTLRHSTSTERALFGFLPLEARIVDSNLVEGDRISFVSRGQRGAVWYALRDAETEGSYRLADLAGPSKGRSVPLVPGRAVAVGWKPDKSGLPLYVDDEFFDATCFSIVVDPGAHEARLTKRGTAPLRVNGLEVSQSARILPGSTIEVSVHAIQEATLSLVPLRTISFAFSQRESVEERSPYSRVRFEPSTRRPLPLYGRLERDVIPAQPRDSETPAIRWEQIAFPLVGGVLVSLVLNNNFGFMIFAVVQPMAYLFGHFRDKRARAKKYRNALNLWEREIGTVVADFSGLVENEMTNRRESAKPATSWISKALRRSPEVWERRPSDDDFMTVRVGRGESVSGYLSALRYQGVSSDPVEQKRIDETVMRAAHLADVPVIANFASDNIAVVGPNVSSIKLVASMLLQVAIQNSPRDVTLAALLPSDPELAAPLEWLKWLPHFQSASTVLPSSHVAFGRRDSAELLSQILERLAERQAFRPDDNSSRVILLVHEAAEVDHSRITELIEVSNGLVHVLWIGSGRASRPSIIDFTVTIQSSEDAHIEAKAIDRQWNDVAIQWEGIQSERARFVAQRLAPLYDPLALGTNGAIPQKVPLSSVLNVSDNSTRNPAVSSLSIPLGIAEHGSFNFDFVNDSPHVLIGGTTGSGKSGLLQSMVAALVARYNADQVNLLLVDYKGGATFKTFKDLPHVIGFVSDLGPQDVTRVLDFMREELLRRARLFDETLNDEGAPVRDFIEYCGVAGEGKLARLIVIFDEFAALIEQQGQLKLMERVEDLAQRGRSWGVHLVLATQQPSSQVVSGRIKANIGARIALRTMDASNSETIIDSREAASIPKALKGRALARLGESQLVVFQAAFADSTQEYESKHSHGVRVKSSPFALRES